MEEKKDFQEAVIEQLINEVEGVVSSKVKFDDKGSIIEIHVLANKSRNAKQIVRDIQSAVTAKHDIQIDHRVISVAQINCGEGFYKDYRLVLNGIEIVRRALEVEVKVILSYEEKEYVGYQKGINTNNNINRTIVQATLGAVENFLGCEGIFIVEGIRNIIIADKDIVSILITCMGKSYEELLTGSSVVSGDLREAIVKATLDAVNRRINKLISK